MYLCWSFVGFFFSSRRRHTRFDCDWSSDVCSSDLTPQSGFHDGAAARGLEKIEKRKHLVVHGQRQVVGKVLSRFLGPLFQPRIDRKGHLRHFVNRRWNGGGISVRTSTVGGPPRVCATPIVP